MLRGREGKLAAVHFAALSAAGTALCFAVAPAAGWICLSLCALLGAIFAAFTRRRYREIRRLSQYLASVYSGGKPLDIRDNREGELSILKNDLYKITCVLTRQAEQLHRDKDYLAEAMQNISHQLKTPLTSLFVMTELLRSPDLPADRREEFWQSTGQSLERIQWLVGTLLKFSRLDAEAVAFAREELSLADLLARAAAPLRPLLEGRRLSLSIDCPPALTWRGDGEWTAEALGNLLKNCAEHTPPGGDIRVRCSENPLHTEIAICDSGEGIDPGDLPHLFERFYKGKNAASDGVGIGLAMAKTILQSQNADVSARNRPEGGAEFSVKLYKQIV